MSISAKRRISDWFFFFSRRRRHTRFDCDWSSDVCSSDLGSRDLSITGRQQYQNVTVVDTGKHADFIVRLEDSQGWTTDDMNFGDMSTISLERRENDISTRRHLSSINACYVTIYTPSTDLNSFPLQRLLLLNQSTPINQSLTGASLSTEIRQNLSHMASSLNEMQRQAFNISHLTGSSAVVVQGPPGTGKTHVLTLTTIAYAMARKKKCLVATPSNNAANEFAEKDMRDRKSTRLNSSHSQIS